MAASTLTSGTLAMPYMPMTVAAIPCPPPVLPKDFDNCLIPGGLDLWSGGGFYSPGQCFAGYQAMCTQSALGEDEWPIREGETAVRCVPLGYTCNDKKLDQKYATTDFDGTVLSAPAFEIRWKSEDLHPASGDHFPPWTLTPPPPLTTSATVPTISPTAEIPDVITTTGQPSQPSQPSQPTQPDVETQRPPPSGVSPGGIAGIAVGCGTSVVGLTMAGVFLALRRRRRRAGPARLPGDWDFDKPAQGSPPVELNNKPMEPKELSGDSAPGVGGRPESGSRMPCGASPNVTHVSLNDTPIELPAEPVKRQ